MSALYMNGSSHMAGSSHFNGGTFGSNSSDVESSTGGRITAIPLVHFGH